VFWRKLFCCALTLCFFWAAGFAGELPENRQIFQQIDRSFQELSAITGLAAKKKVHSDLISRDKVAEFLKYRVKESVKPDELRAEELTLKKLGFVPQDFNLEKSTVDLLTEQAAAFYDYHKKRLYLTDWSSSGMQESALVHELAHALADQHFHLERFIKQGGQSDDSELARMAVMEGQATWLMAEALARRAGQSISTNPALLDSMSGAGDESASEYPVFNSVPLYLRETLVFPYTEGGRFQNAVYEKMGKAAFSEVFRQPPDTTQQILHPQKYFDHVEPVDPEFPYVSPGKGFKELSDGMLGELDHAILIRQFGTRSQADKISPHWKGGRYSLLEDKLRTRVILQYASQWDSEATAREFFHFYRQVLQKKWKKMQVAAETANELSGTGDDGYFVVKLAGPVVTSLEGLAALDQAKPVR
jgi:hypothetical protein